MLKPVILSLVIALGGCSVMNQPTREDVIHRSIERAMSDPLDVISLDASRVEVSSPEMRKLLSLPPRDVIPVVLERMEAAVDGNVLVRLFAVCNAIARNTNRSEMRYDEAPVHIDPQGIIHPIVDEAEFHQMKLRMVAKVRKAFSASE